MINAAATSKSRRPLWLLTRLFIKSCAVFGFLVGIINFNIEGVVVAIFTVFVVIVVVIAFLGRHGRLGGIEVAKEDAPAASTAAKDVGDPVVTS